MKTLLTIFALTTLAATAQISPINPLFNATVFKPAAAGGPEYPATISGILQFNYGDAATASPGSAISTWEATVGNNFTGGTGGTRPTVETNLIAGKAIKVIRFDGTDDFLTNKFTATATQPFTQFFTFRDRDGTLGTSVRYTDSALNETPRCIMRRDSAPAYALYSGVGFQNLSPTPTTNWNIYVVIFDGANTRASLNGRAWDVVGGSPGTDNPTGATLAVANDTTSAPAQINFECFGMINNTNAGTWFAALTNWMHGRIY